MNVRLFDLVRDAKQKEKKNLGDKSLLVALSAYKKARAVLENRDNAALSKIYLKAKGLERTVGGSAYGFATFQDLVTWTNDWIKTFPRTYDVVVGIPRAGMLVASLIALKMAKPLATPDVLARDEYWVSEFIGQSGEIKNVLLVDDGIGNGERIQENVEILKRFRSDLTITTAVLVATEESKNLVDLYYTIIPRPRMFEWNLMHSKKGKLASDLDGVICEDCPSGVDLDDSRYSEWVQNAKPYLIPAFEIDAIISNRLEKYRSETEKWLARHGVSYKELILWDIPSKHERRGHAQHKTDALLKVKPDIFWESSVVQAHQIWEATKIPVVCFDEMRMFG